MTTSSSNGQNIIYLFDSPAASEIFRASQTKSLHSQIHQVYFDSRRQILDIAGIAFDAGNLIRFRVNFYAIKIVSPWRQKEQLMK